MSFDHIAIQISNLSKCYQIYGRPQDRLKQAILPRVQRWLGNDARAYYDEFWALKNISFNVYKGETLGIIGRNGSGKSTLLQVIAGTLAPSAGNTIINGRVAALLELGAGFNPEFTGRENVFMNAAILGLSNEEILHRYDRIVEFADIGEFIEQPIKTYSSGMYTRLAFAVAINVDPDILVIDEALSVGDEAFQRKCYGRIEKIKEQGATILFVSHATGTVIDLCDRALLLDEGERLLTGRPKTVVSLYQKLVYARAERKQEIRQQIINQDLDGNDVLSQKEIHLKTNDENDNTIPDVDSPAVFDETLKPTTTVEYLSKGVTVRDVHFRDRQGRRVNVLVPGQVYQYCYIADFHKSCAMVRFGMLLKTLTGMELAGQASHAEGDGLNIVEKDSSVEVVFEVENRLLPGIYFGNAGVLANDEDGHSFMHRLIDATMFRVEPGCRDESIATGTVDLRPTSTSSVHLHITSTRS